MKKSTCYLLLVILLLQSGGALLFFQAHQKCIQYRMNEKLQSSNSTFEKIILTEDEYKEASINSREIFVDGKLYDVKSTIVSEGKIELSVIQDVEEKNILDRISSFLKGSGSPEGNISFQLQKLVSLIYLSALPDYHFYIPYARFNLFLPATLSCDSKDLEIYSPPPELV